VSDEFQGVFSLETVTSLGGLDPIHCGEPKLNPAMELLSPGPDEPPRIGEAERNEQQARLIHVPGRPDREP
jgi:hypothetical protein